MTSSHINVEKKNISNCYTDKQLNFEKKKKQFGPVGWGNDKTFYVMTPPTRNGYSIRWRNGKSIYNFDFYVRLVALFIG